MVHAINEFPIPRTGNRHSPCARAGSGGIPPRWEQGRLAQAVPIAQAQEFPALFVRAGGLADRELDGGRRALVAGLSSYGFHAAAWRSLGGRHGTDGDFLD